MSLPDTCAPRPRRSALGRLGGTARAVRHRVGHCPQRCDAPVLHPPRTRPAL